MLSAAPVWDSAHAESHLTVTSKQAAFGFIAFSNEGRTTSLNANCRLTNCGFAKFHQEAFVPNSTRFVTMSRRSSDFTIAAAAASRLVAQTSTQPVIYDATDLGPLADYGGKR
jgi:hypothetical protein